MSFPTQLVPAARSAYRSILRASRITFQGDLARRIALDQTARGAFSSPTLVVPGPSSPDSKTDSAAEEKKEVSFEELGRRIEEWKEIAMFLRKNVVQGELDESGSYKLRVHSETDLGDNLTVKEPPKLSTTPFPNRNRKKCGEA